MVAATTVATETGPSTVFVASSLEDVNEALTQAGSLALVALPVVVAALVAVMWALVGRALAPVEAIRREADEISGQDLHRRVPEPPTRDEIGRLARTLNHMLDRLETASNRQQRFVADAAHELRTPITSVRAQLETAHDSPRSIDWTAVATDVLEETTRMQQLIDQLLVLAGADAAPPPHSSSPSTSTTSPYKSPPHTDMTPMSTSTWRLCNRSRWRARRSCWNMQSATS